MTERPHYVLCMLALTILATPAITEAKEGFYIGVGIGGALVDGDDPVTIESDVLIVNGCSENPECVTTEYAEGLGTLFRFGYNIKGIFSIETSILSHGLGADDLEAQGHLIFAGVLHPIGIANVIETDGGAEVKPEMIFWDPYILAGGGMSWGVYHASIDDDDKGWTSTDFQAGLGLNMHFGRLVSAGIDMRWTLAHYDEWIFNYDDNIVSDPISEPVGVVFTPMAVLTLHVD